MDFDSIVAVDWKAAKGSGARPKGEVRVMLEPLAAGGPEEKAFLFGVDDPKKVCTLLENARMDRDRSLGTGLFDRAYEDWVGNTHFMHAVAKGDLKTAEKLLESGAEVDRANRRGLTPLMSAARGGHLEVTRLLLESNADPSRVDEDGKNARDHAIDCGKQAIADLLAGTARRG